MLTIVDAFIRFSPTSGVRQRFSGGSVETFGATTGKFDCPQTIRVYNEVQLIRRARHDARLKTNA
jgi:hypothetical protein